MLTPDVVNPDLWGFFYASHFATDIKVAVTVDQNELAVTACKRLAEQRFDQAPVIFQERIVGWVLTSQLSEAETVNSAMTQLDNSIIVSAETSIPRALQLLGQHDFVFTADKDGLAGFIVPSDLDRHAVRSYFYLLVARIEMLLSEIIRSAMPKEAIIATMRPGLQERYEQAHEANTEAHPVEYLYIRQLIKLFFATSHSKDPLLWNESLTEQLAAVEKFRNLVMHPTCSIAATTSPSAAAEVASGAEEVAGRLRQMIIELRGHQADNR
jgi:CBS domain-containing protein